MSGDVSKREKHGARSWLEEWSRSGNESVGG